MGHLFPDIGRVVSPDQAHAPHHPPPQAPTIRPLRPITRSPWTPEGTDELDRTLAFVLGEVEHRLSTEGLPNPELRLFTGDSLWRLPLEQITWPGFEPDLAEIFAGIGQHMGVERRFRLAAIHLAGGEATMGATVMELTPPAAPGKPPGCRYAILPLREKGRKMRPTGPWQMSQTEDVTLLDGALRRQADPGAPPPTMAWPRGSRPPLHAVGQPTPFPPPPDPVMLARVLVGDVLKEALGDKEDSLLAFVIRQGKVERWTLRFGLPCSIHDALRNILLLEPALGVVLVHPTLVELGGELLHALAFSAEAYGKQRGGVVVPLRLGEGGSIQPMKPFPYRQPHLQWMGQKPTQILNIEPLGGSAQ